MERMVAFCGLVCTDCKAFIATQENDDAKRRDVAEDWSKLFGREIKSEEINCDGCLSRDGCHIGYCDVCEIRKCGIDKGVKNCAYCVDYNCEKLARFFEQEPWKRKRHLRKYDDNCTSKHMAT